MRRYTKSWLLAVATTVLALGCATSNPPAGNAEPQLDALLQRARGYRTDAEAAPERLSPERKAELQQLANDVRAWRARTGRDDIRLTDKRVRTARRANDSGGTGNCDLDCPAYTFEGDTICFLERSECSSHPDDYGTICIYSCMSIASEAAR